MDLLSCFHSSYTALLFSQRPSGSSKAPSDPVSAVSSQISHSAADGGQPMSLAPLTLPFITPHLISQGGPACSLLPRQYCWGKSFAHFTHSDLIWGNFLDGYVVEFSLWKFPSQSLGCIVVLTLYIPCFVLCQPLSSCVRSWLPWICLFTLTLLHLASCPCFQKATIWTIFHSFSNVLCNQCTVYTGYSRLNLNRKQTRLTFELCDMISYPH